jgi:hypothetical protein
MNIKTKSAELRTSGYRVIADGKQTTYRHYCKAIEKELSSIRGTPRVYRNMLGELAIDFDNE